jgi:hypothetical protein
MKRLLLVIVLLAVSISPVAAASLTVVTTTPDLAAIAKDVGEPASMSRAPPAFRIRISSTRGQAFWSN